MVLVMSKNQSQHYKSLSVSGRGFWAGLGIALTNLLTLWRCRQCGTKYPHHPFKGHRMGEVSPGVCMSCSHK